MTRAVLGVSATRCVVIQKGSVLLMTLVLAAGPAVAQQPGPASFRVLQRGTVLGSASALLTREEDGWLLQGSSDLPGFKLTVRHLEVHYDLAWHPRHMTVQMLTPVETAIVHVAFGLSGGRTRTDIVRDGEAIYGENTVAADTIVLPDLVFGAYEALAARLASAVPGAELRAFIVPRIEVRVHADSVTDDVVKTAAGTLATRHWHLRFMRAEGPSPVEVWIADGRLVRLDIPMDGMTVVRDDVTW